MIRESFEKTREIALGTRLATATAAALLAVSLSAGPVTAEPQSTPNGPWLTDEQNLSLAALRSYDEL